jgi:PiT family inorganic phosphate transporter
MLMGTCAGVSFAHGSNDGQKGMGLIMLILIGLAPYSFALNLHANKDDLERVRRSTRQVYQALIEMAPGQSEVTSQESSDILQTYLGNPEMSTIVIQAMAVEAGQLQHQFESVDNFREIPKEQRWALRAQAMLLIRSLHQAQELKHFQASPQQLADMRQMELDLDRLIEYVSDWVKVAVALALGIGTMVGWKRIVVTVGEKIGKTGLTYAQGFVAQTVTMGTILGGDRFGLPMSTTHILSSGIAGTMLANRSGLQSKTLTHIVLAWVLTLPASIALSSLIYLALRYII